MNYKVVGGFWILEPSQSRLRTFEYLTKVPSLLKNIQRGLRSKTELMERNLLRQER